MQDVLRRKKQIKTTKIHTRVRLTLKLMLSLGEATDLQTSYRELSEGAEEIS